jgi:hypothetical protein
MNCPKCNHEQSRVIDLKRKSDGLRRGRICAGCGHKFNTLERVEIWDPTLHGYVAPVEARPALAVVSDHFPSATKKVATKGQFHPVVVGDELLTVCEQVRPLMVEWWNNSRHSKHKGNAAWTRAAWLGAVKRVSQLPQPKQVLLVQAGVESGWQTLKLDYIKDELAKPTAAGRPMPKDPAMLAALESWPKQTA